MGYHSNDLPMRACIFAAQRHYGQTRNNKSKTPFGNHLSEVAVLVRDAGGTESELAVSWLHDIIEDTETTLDEITNRFGQYIAGLVNDLTDPINFKQLSVCENKRLQAERIFLKSPPVKRIKIADQTSNVLALNDPPITWSDKRCIEYMQGALLVVKNCQGVSEFLEDKFYKAYRQMTSLYNR